MGFISDDADSVNNIKKIPAKVIKVVIFVMIISHSQNKTPLFYLRRFVEKKSYINNHLKNLLPQNY